MNIPIQLLNAFVVFNDSENIVEAAIKLQITQPGLSKQLRLLEEKLPHPLYTFSGRRKILTAFGKDLHAQLKTRLGNLQEVVRQTCTLHEKPQQAQIRLAARRGILDRISAELQFPGALVFQESSNEQIIQDLLALKVEIGILHQVPDTAELIAKPLFKEEFQLAIPKKLLPQKRNFGKALFSDLAKLPCIGFKQEDELINKLFTFHDVSHQALQFARTTANYSSIGAMVDAKLGWAVIPSYLNMKTDKNWLIPIPSDVISTHKFFMVYRKEYKENPWFRDLLQEVTDCFKN